MAAENQLGGEKPLPLGAFRFVIEMEDKPNAVSAFAQFSGIKVSVDTIEARSGSDIRGVPLPVAAFTRFEPVTLSKGVVGDNDFLSWLFDAAAGPEAGPKAEERHTLNVVSLDDEGKRKVIWTLKDAFPIGYELSPMDGLRSEVLAETLTFSISGVTRTVEE